MIDVTILYPKSEGSTFDLDYYTNTHMPLFVDALGEAALKWGVSSSHGNDYHALGWVQVSSQEALGAALSEHGAKIMGDVANYTNVQPVLITGDVVVVK